MTQTTSPITLCALEDIPDGGSKGILPNARGRDRAFLVRKGDHVYGYVNTCPHYDRAPMAWKKDEFSNGSRDKIMCAAHGALFNIEDGACVIGPCLGQALQPIELRIEAGFVIGRVGQDTL